MNIGTIISVGTIDVQEPALAHPPAAAPPLPAPRPSSTPAAVPA